jgi:hypothetical protein
MINLTLASGRVTNSDVVRVEYVKPDSNPPVILINWPPQPSVIEPNPKALAAIATSVVRIMAAAQARLARIRSNRLSALQKHSVSPVAWWSFGVR